MIKQFSWRHIRARWAACWRDETAVAMTEYLIVSVFVTLPVVYYLFDPDNAIYQGARSQFDATTDLLMMLGP
jgi:hypothetical protein